MSLGQNIRVIINPKSGVAPPLTISAMLKATQDAWEDGQRTISYQFSQSPEDARKKTRQAIEDQVDTVAVVGGDGMVNMVGSEMLGSNIPIAVIPTGSGNGFARHFGIPLQLSKAAETLNRGHVIEIDVGEVNNEHIFLVTCSMAWDADVLKQYEKIPARGVLPYWLSGVVGLIEFQPQNISVSADGAEMADYEKPMICTIANLNQWGGGAKIAPQACADDGIMELVITERKDSFVIATNLYKLFMGTVDQVPEVKTTPFSTLEVVRERPSRIQLDGELVDCDANLSVKVLPKALKVLVP